VVSRRALLEQERDSLKQEILKVLEEGVILEGTVKNITGYGAFVDLGGIDGILTSAICLGGGSTILRKSSKSGRRSESSCSSSTPKRNDLPRHETVDA
jgi:polyribonucleotide nucleotidyltransferase